MDSAQRVDLLRRMVALYRQDGASFRFHEVVSAVADVPVHAIDPNDHRDAELLSAINGAAEVAFERLRGAPKRGVSAQGFGNHVKRVMGIVLREREFELHKPRGKFSGGATGYPDFEIADRHSRTACLLVKTCATGRTDDTRPVVVISLSGKHPGINVSKPARHLLVAFRHERLVEGDAETFRPIKWTVHDLFDLEVDLSYSYSSSNQALYVDRGDLILRQGAVEGDDPPISLL